MKNYRFGMSVAVHQRMKHHSTLLCSIALASAFATGCASSEHKRTAYGGVGGAAVGGAAGALIGGGKGAIIGAATGAVIGGGVGAYLDKQQRELDKVAETKRTEEGLMVQLKNDLLFETGKADITPEAQQQLTQLGQILAKYPDDRIRIDGFTDSTGSAEFNQLLSQQRAQAVQGALASQGVKPQQMSSQGKGEAQPVASNKDAAGRTKNRRVELHIDVPTKQAG